MISHHSRALELLVRAMPRFHFREKFVKLWPLWAALEPSVGTFESCVLP